ncbi:MAG: hypothetical protein ACR2G2_14135, partial [Pseudonocardia sp.]
TGEGWLRVPPKWRRGFWGGFFILSVRPRPDFLDGRCRPVRTAAAMAGLFATTPWPVRRRLIGSFLSQDAPPDYADRSSQE